MSDYQMTFQRYEIKYLLDPVSYQKLRQALQDYVKVDNYGKATICNIYYDTPDYRLIRTSLEKPVYKEKLRLRCYGTATDRSTAFVELKKKYKGIVYKRREDMSLKDAELFLNQGIQPGKHSQVMEELSSFCSYYPNLQPAMYLSYDRIATYGVEDPSLRITFDSKIRSREDCLDLRTQAYGEELLPCGYRLMEIKIAGAMPLWLSHILDSLQIYPTSFSKYGRAYERKIIEQTGGIYCA